MKKPTFAAGVLVLCIIVATAILIASILGFREVVYLTQAYGSRTPSEWVNHQIARDYFHSEGSFIAELIYFRNFILMPITLLTIGLTIYIFTRGSKSFRVFAVSVSILTISIIAVTTIGLSRTNTIVEWIVE